MLRVRIALPLLACLAAACATGVPPPAELPGLHISGAHFVDGSGTPVRLLGVNRSGTEFACVQDHGIFDGPSDAASVAVMASWRIDAVRVPLNEDCWLGINGVPAIYGGNTYRQAIAAYVGRLHRAALAVILDLHWAAPGASMATTQLPMPDADHAAAFWGSVAAAFRGDHDIVFDLYNEPFVDTGNAETKDPWACWRDGCTMHAGYGVATPWRAAGMQSLVDAVRGAGATQPLILGGLRWANDLSGWPSHEPSDPLQQLAAGLHLYNFNACASSACWNGDIAPVAAGVPTVTGELGENDCGGGFIDGYMPWADAHGVSYLGWTWNAWDCRAGPALISDYSGTPTRFGAALHAHLRTQMRT